MGLWAGDLAGWPEGPQSGNGGVKLWQGPLCVAVDEKGPARLSRARGGRFLCARTRDRMRQALADHVIRTVTPSGRI
jgi:hypothetical protein